MGEMPQAAERGDNYHMQSGEAVCEADCGVCKPLHFGALLLSRRTEEPPPSALRREQGLEPSADRGSQ